MKKSKAIELLGGSISSAARELEITYQAVDKWPDDLPRRIADRVLGAYARRSFPHVFGEDALDDGGATTQPAELATQGDGVRAAGHEASVVPTGSPVHYRAGIVR